MKNKIKISQYYMTKKSVVTQKELVKREQEIKICIDANDESIKRLLAQKNSLVVKFIHGDSVKTYHRTPDDMKRVRSTVENLKMQNWQLKKELEILMRLKNHEWT